MEYLGGGSALDLMKAGSLDEIHISIILRCVFFSVPSLPLSKFEFNQSLGVPALGDKV